MFQGIGRTKSGFQPNDLIMLQRLLDDWCEKRGCKNDDSRGQEAARELIIWFEQGVTKEDQLRQMIGLK